MDSIDNLAYPVRSKATAFRIIDDEAVILSLDSGIYYSLNEVGARIWDLCDGGKSIKDIKMAICKEFEVAEDIAEKDILELMDDLLQEGLIDIHGDPQQAEPNQKS